MERKEEDDKKEKKEEEAVHLRRKIGLLPAVCFIIGTVVGSGIFIAPKGVLMNSGSVGLSLLVPAVASFVSLAFGRYVVEPFFAPCAAPTVLIKLVSILGVTFVVAVNCYSVTMATRTQVTLTFIKMFAMVLIIIPGIIALAKVTVFYVLVNVAYYTMMTPTELLLSDAVAVTFANRALQGLANVIPVLVALSCLGALNGGFFGSPRMLFVGAREGHWPPIFSMIHIRRHTPLPAVLFLYPMVMLILINGEIYQLINFTSFARWFFVALTTLGMLIHRYRFPLYPRPFKVPLVIAATFTVVCFFIVIMSLYSDPWNTGWSCALTLTGVPVYYLTVYRFRLPHRWRRIFNYCSKQLQILLEVAQQEVKTY
ncbi:hypothetical protein PAMP_015190 [Pampus punctatissimus]